MSAAAAPKPWRARAVQAVALLVGFLLVFLAQASIPQRSGVMDAINGLGFLLLAGTLLSELVEVVGLPHLSGYLLAGLVAGPHVLDLVDHHSVEQLQVVNALALALIALAGGAELRLEALKRVLKSLAWANLTQMVLVTAVTGGAFLALGRFIPFMRELPVASAAVVALLWGVMSTSRSPAAVLGLMSQLRPKGPVTEFSVAFVMLSNVVVIVVVALVVALAKLVLDPSATFEPQAFQALGRELLGSAALGTTLGIVLAVYLRVSGRQLLLVLLALGFGLTELLDYVHLDPLLAFMVAGFVVQNFSTGGEKLRTAVEKTGAIVFVIFFATAGAHLDLPLLGRVWPITLALVAVRAAATWGAGVASSRLAKDEPMVARWGWSGLVAQAGLTFVLIVIVQRQLPELDAGFATLTIGVAAVNEVIGPVLFKLGLDRSGESGKAVEKPEEARAPTASA